MSGSKSDPKTGYEKKTWLSLRMGKTYTEKREKTSVHGRKMGKPVYMRMHFATGGGEERTPI